MTAAVDWAPLARLLVLASLAALLVLAWLWLRRPQADAGARLAALTALVLFLTFDLIVFGAFTRLTDSGLGCPDWPGCYGHASPLGARDRIADAQAALPDGPVTHGKAWIEMIHRYLAMTVGALILVIAGASLARRRELPHSPLLPLATLAWVVVQGLFGKYTVTLKLQPVIVTLHLLGGVALLALLALQHASFAARPPLLAPQPWRAAAAVLALLAAQVALGGWVSTNYAVLACRGFPTCNGHWWPPADFSAGFGLWRELGRGVDGGWLGLDALVAIHLAHRLFALVVLAAGAALVVALVRSGGAARRAGHLLALLLALQLASGLSNVVLDWPLAAALAHSAGAAALVLLLTLLLARGRARGVRAA